MFYRIIKDKKFKKSSYSPSGTRSTRCVGVAIEQDSVSLTHINNNAPILQFTREEWSAFIQGVKDGQFDLT